MHNRQAILGIVAAVVIILGAGAVVLLNSNKHHEPNSATASKSASPTNATNQATIASIFESRENRKCTFDNKTANSETKGTILVYGDNAFGQFILSSSDKAQDMSIIRNGDTFYVWGSGLPQGMKMTMSVEDLSKQIANSQYSTFDPSQKTNITCVTWAVDQSLFTPPLNIKFFEVGKVALPTNTKPTVTGPKTTSAPSSNCSLCNSMTGAAKQACLSGLHCQ